MFVYRQKTAYELLISDWSADVCSSDLTRSSAPSGVSALSLSMCSLPFSMMPPGIVPVRAARPNSFSRVSSRALRSASRSPGRSGTASRAVCSIACGGTRSCLRRSEEHTSELPSLMRISYAVFCLKKKKANKDRKQQSDCPKIPKQQDARQTYYLQIIDL